MGCDRQVSPIETETLILGGGLAGLSAASVLGERAIVLEKESRPGGLVRCLQFGDYWFDRVLHILYFSDPRTEQRITALLGSALVFNPPVAFVETQAGATRYPLQVHLNGLERETVIRCIHDLAREHFTSFPNSPRNFEEALLRAFGAGICEIFMFPYNQKVWKHSLSNLAASGFQWNIAQPGLSEVLRGALTPYDEFAPYNGKGWYPVIPRDQPVRGMEYLSAALAANAHDLRLGHRIVSIDLDSRTVTAERHGETLLFRYRKLCSTLPLPLLLDLCPQTPESIRATRGELMANRVISVAFSVEGPRPRDSGHWRYYSDPALIFNRLIFMHQFDPGHAPKNGWGLMAEITMPQDQSAGSRAEIAQRTMSDVLKTGVINGDCKIIDTNVFEANPGYVLFTEDNRRIVENARSFFAGRNVELLGRYGRWEYSSMAQVMRDGFEWAESMVTAGCATP